MKKENDKLIGSIYSDPNYERISFINHEEIHLDMLIECLEKTIDILEARKNEILQIEVLKRTPPRKIPHLSLVKRRDE